MEPRPGSFDPAALVGLSRRSVMRSAAVAARYGVRPGWLESTLQGIGEASPGYRTRIPEWPMARAEAAAYAAAILAGARRRR